MKFIISRTSEWGDSSPCEEAKKEIVWVTEESPCLSPNEYDRYGSSYPWLSVGKNHRVSPDGHIRRDVPRAEWVVNVDSIEDLMELSKKYGELIVSNKLSKKELAPNIEIYDAYRE